MKTTFDLPESLVRDASTTGWASLSPEFRGVSLADLVALSNERP